MSCLFLILKKNCTIEAKLINVIMRFSELCVHISLYLIHNGQQFTEGQTEPPEGITVFKLQGEAML